MSRAWRPTCASPISPSISARGTNAATESITTTSSDLERLLAGVGLADQELVHVDADGGGVHRVHGVLGVDVGAHPAVALRLGHHVHGQRRLPRCLGTEDLHHPTPGQASDAERDVEGEGAGGDGGHADVAALSQLHDGALAELLLDLADGHLERLVAFHDGTLLVVCAMSCVSGEAPSGATYGGGMTSTPDASGRHPNDTRVT